MELRDSTLGDVQPRGVSLPWDDQSAGPRAGGERYKMKGKKLMPMKIDVFAPGFPNELKEMNPPRLQVTGWRARSVARTTCTR